MCVVGKASQNEQQDGHYFPTLLLVIVWVLLCVVKVAWKPWCKWRTR